MAGSSPAMTTGRTVVTPVMTGPRIIPGLDPGTRDDPGIQSPTPGAWMAGSGPAMTVEGRA